MEMMGAVFNKIILLVLILPLGWLSPIQANINKHLSIPDKIDCLEINVTQLDLQLTCPEIFQSLQQQGLINTLETPLLNQLSQRQLKMLQKALPSVNRNALLNDSDLDSLLAEIYTEKEKNQEDSWWKQLIDWLNRNKPEKYETEYNWLVDLMKAITPSAETAKFLMYSLFFIIIAVTLGLLIRSLYFAGIFNQKKRKTEENIPLKVASGEKLNPTLSATEIRKLPPSEQTITLLKSAIAHLTRTESLPNNKALTNSELKRYLQHHNLSSATPFSKLLAEVEPVLYGNVIPTEQLLENCWQHTEQIIKP